MVKNDSHEVSKPELLIVDDEEEILNALRRIFRRKWNVHTANNAQDAYEIAKQVPIAVIISDQRMPNVTGTEFFAKIREERPDIVCLSITGYADIQAVIDAINKGSIYQYITKPWDTEELSVIVNSALDKYQLLQENKRLLHELKQTNEILEQEVIRRTQELKDINKCLEDLNIVKNEILGMATHDLRSPLNTIMGFSEIMMAPTQISMEQRLEWTQIIYECSENMLEIIEKFLDVSKIESGTIELNLERVDIATFIKHIAIRNTPIIAKKNITLEMDLPSELPTVIFDSRRIEQVCNNLIANACKFSPPESTIAIEVCHKDKAIEIAVVDHGKGIVESDLQKIFRPFEQLKSGLEHKGIGLGLAICKKLVEMHRGTIGVNSIPNKETRFFFTIPIRELDASTTICGS